MADPRPAPRRTRRRHEALAAAARWEYRPGRIGDAVVILGADTRPLPAPQADFLTPLLDVNVQWQTIRLNPGGEALLADWDRRYGVQEVWVTQDNWSTVHLRHVAGHTACSRRIERASEPRVGMRYCQVCVRRSEWGV